MEQCNYVFLVGAAKSGTTSLAELLNQHAQLVVSKEKESDYFSRHNHHDLSWYESQFEHKPAKWRLDASTSYSAGFGGSSTPILQRIYQFAPNAKIIYVLRDPIERTWASYWHAVRGGFENKTFEESIRQQHCPYIEGSLYYKRFCEIKGFFESQNILLLEFDELKDTPELTTQKVFEFLGLDSGEVQPNNEIKTHSNKSFKWKGPFFWLSYIPTSWLKFANKAVKLLFPKAFFDFIKSSISEPTPKINSTQANLIKSIIDADTEAFKHATNIEISKSQWWG